MTSNSSQFEKLIKNKTVALVGPAAYMVGSSFGEEINKCDVVIRINRSYESIDKYPQDVGDRTDVLYSCLIEKQANAGELNLKKLKKYGIKFICAPPQSSYDGIAKETKFHVDVNAPKMKTISKEVPIRIVEHDFHTKLAKAVSCRPNTGYLAIYDLLQFDIKKLKLFGFSFYLDGFVDDVKKGVELEQNVTEKQFADMCFNSKRHIQKNMWSYAKKTLPNNMKVKLDKILTKILSLNNLDREEFKKSI